MLKLYVFLLTFTSVYLLYSGTAPVAIEVIYAWQKKRLEKIMPKLENIFIEMPFKKLMFLTIIAPLACGLLGFMFFKQFIAMLIGAAIGVVLPSFLVKQIELGRKRKFIHQLVDGLMILSTGLKAGLSLVQTIEILVEEMPPPISQEFGLVLRENNMGFPLSTALTNLKERMPSEELDLIVTSILVSRETGGDLTKVFSQLVFTIRERGKLLGRLKALTVQGRLQGGIMSILPIAFGMVIFSLNKDFFSIMMQDSVGRMLLVYSVVSEALGIFFIRKLSRVEV